jgi:endonuclease/exonuclease/phosphatase (EEP) superfamily protein YafD
MTTIWRTFAIIGLVNLAIPAADAFWFRLPDKEKTISNYGQASQESIDPENIDVLVWNTYKAQNPSWQADYEMLSAGKDISVLQECFMMPVMKYTLESDQEMHYKFATSFIYKKSGIATGTCTGSTVMPAHFHHEKTKDVEVAGFTPKVLLLTEYPLTDRQDTLLVINIHALNSVPAIVLWRHIKLAQNDIEKHRGPVIYGGDFNTWSPLKVWVVKRFMKKMNMQEVEFPNGGERMRASVTKLVIDYIFTRGLSVKESWVWGNLQGADHKAMTATFRVN